MADTGMVHLARNGQILGDYEAEKIGDLLEMGRLMPTDHFYDAKARVWRLVSEWKIEDFRSVEEEDIPETTADSPERPHGGRRKKGRSKSKKGDKTAIFALITCLLAFGVAAGIWAWALGLQQKLAAATDQIRFLNEKLDSINKEKQLLSEIAPSGQVRGIFTYEPSYNQAAIISGATVGLYRRADVEAAIAKIASEQPLNAGNFDDAIEKLKTAISAPLKISLSDSNGRFNLDVPEPGDYVLVASAGKKVGDVVQRYVWLQGFRSENQPSSLILLNDKNALSSSRPRLAISTMPSLVWKAPPQEENAAAPSPAPAPSPSPAATPSGDLP